ncbi:MAG: ATP-binding cassette domain-containing protein, partial [Candidatus Omnitrophica bacterium]|nr:ATP-binding cassette domain-containing protein [Candidatus Omnitrophota bacterium]
GEVNIDGSSTVYPISAAIGEEFSKIHPDVKVSVAYSGTGGGFKKFYAGQIDISNASRPIKKEEIEGEILVRNLSYSLKNKEVLKDINLKVDKGKFVGIVGDIGSGKTTLFNLLLRLYQPPQNTIFIDGVAIENIPLEKLYSNIGYVEQSPFLFSGTIRENICFGRDNINQEYLEKIADFVQIKEDIDKFPLGYDTWVGERGVTLSGGQKQRITLARALIISPKILLLDNALSQVDVNTQKIILNNLKSRLTTTKILVTNQFNILRELDYIFVFIRGQIVEEGIHDTLIRKKGMYYQLYQTKLIEG